MPISINWDNGEPGCLVWTFEGFWNWEEVGEAVEKSITMRKSNDYEGDICVILNLEHASTHQMSQLRKAHDALMMRPDGRDLVVVVGRNIFVQTMVDIFRQRYLDMKEQFTSAPTLNDARRLIRIHRTGHP